MKTIIKPITSILITLLLAINVMGQDADFSVQIQTYNPLNGIIPKGDTAIYQLTIQNTGSSPLVKHSVLVTVSAPSDGKIVGVLPGSDMGIWAVQSLNTKDSANTIKIVNHNGDMGYFDFDQELAGINTHHTTNIYLQIVGVHVSDFKKFGANVVFNVLLLGVPADEQDEFTASDYTAQGNASINNDNQSTSLKVIERADAPLPVKLKSFTAQYESAAVETNWEIENELSFSHYEVERSKDGIIFSSIGSIAAANNKNYNYTDNLNNFNSSLVYYRLKMVDKDGKVTYSSIRKLSLEKEKEVSIKIYPNPVLKESALNVELGGLEAGAHTISMIAVNGVVVKNRTFKIPSTGSTTLVIITSNIPSGTYTVVIKGPTHQYTRTVVVAGR